jgi:hypothetical protein
MDWTDVHCQRQFKRARNLLSIAYSREQTKTEVSGWSAYRVEKKKNWRATTDEDRHYCFAVAL